VQIKLRLENLTTVRSWDGVNKRWRFRRLGRKFYRVSQDSYAVTFPVHTTLVQVSGSVCEDATVLKSTATVLCESQTPTLMPDE
jgi:hypothetical protein